MVIKLRFYQIQTTDVFSINISGYDNGDVYLPVQVLDELGRIIQHAQLAKYDNVYTGQFSVYDYPAGIYFVRVVDPAFRQMAKVIKE